MRSGKDGYHHGSLHDVLLAQALEALEKNGVGGLSLRALAEAAGVSKTAPYRHFADKRELLVALAAEGFGLLAARLEAVVGNVAGVGAAPGTAVVGDGGGAGAGQASAILALRSAYLAFAQERPALYSLMFSKLGYSLHSERCRANSERALGSLAAAVARAQALGWKPGVDPATLMLSVWAQVHGWAGILNEGLLPEPFAAASGDWERLSGALLD
jgi:AcrR family transcriptional regulator